jgi:hypothetical protein
MPPDNLDCGPRLLTGQVMLGQAFWIDLVLFGQELLKGVY